MASFNKVILVGNMTADPELKQTQGGLSISSFSIAVNRRSSKEGEQGCDFINIVSWRQQAEFVTRYFKKGQAILVCGRLQTRSWTDNQGNKRYATEVVADEVSFVGNNASNTEAEKQPPAPNPTQWGNKSYIPDAYSNNAPQFEELHVEDNSLPF